MTKKKKPTTNVAEQIFTQEFVTAVLRQHQKGEALVSVREVMASLGTTKTDVERNAERLYAAGLEFHGSDIQDATLPTLRAGRGSRKQSAIGVAFRGPR